MSQPFWLASIVSCCPCLAGVLPLLKPPPAHPGWYLQDISLSCTSQASTSSPWLVLARYSSQLLSVAIPLHFLAGIFQPLWIASFVSCCPCLVGVLPQLTLAGACGTSPSHCVSQVLTSSPWLVPARHPHLTVSLSGLPQLTLVGVYRASPYYCVSQVPPARPSWCLLGLLLSLFLWSPPAHPGWCLLQESSPSYGSGKLNIT